MAANLLNGVVFAGQNGTPVGFYHAKKSYFSPRVGFALALTGDDRTSLRGGYGLGYTRLPYQQLFPAFGSNPPQNATVTRLFSTLQDPINGNATALTPQAITMTNPNFRVAELQSFSLTLERSVTSSLLAQVAYAGGLGRHLTGGQDINWPTGTSGLCGAPVANYDFDPCLNTGSISPNILRPYKGFSTINDQYLSGTSNYNSLQTALRYNHGSVQLDAAYTYSKALTDVSGISSGAQNPYDFAAEYGLPAYDRTHVFTATWVYPLPVFLHNGNQLEKEALGGWQLAGLAVAESGFALTPTIAAGYTGLATRPNLMHRLTRPKTKQEWFDTSAFAIPAAGYYGNASNGDIRGPGDLTFNVALQKTFALPRETALLFRAEAFNVANHPNWGAVSTGVGSTNYGQVYSAQDPRIMQFSLRLVF